MNPPEGRRRAAPKEELPRGYPTWDGGIVSSELRAEIEEEFARRVRLETGESQAKLLTLDLLERMLDAAEPVWHFGDGEGGWLLLHLRDAAIRRGLPVPQQSISLPKVGARIKAVYERDQYRCQECSTWIDLTIDHIMPRSKGGTNDMENLRVLCRSCNSRKRDRMPEVVG